MMKLVAWLRARLDRPLALAVLVGFALLATIPRAPALPVKARLAVASENEIGTREALAQMLAGGSAVDAAVTAALIGGVASPTSSGIGGGGFALVWNAADKRVVVLDFRETAPAAVDAAAFERRPFASGERGKLVGTPGEVAGLFELHRRFGKRAWKDVVEPAIRVAKSGYPVNAHLGAMLPAYKKDLIADPGLVSVFFPNGQPAAVGALVKNEKLAATLGKIAAQGPKGFYEGEVAADLVAAAKSVGGALSASDLGAYRPMERVALHVRWEGYDVYTMPPPSAGGMMLAEALKTFSKAELQKLKLGSGAYQHMLAESMRGALGDRMRFVGDPALETVDTDRLLADARIAARKKKLALDRTHAVPRFGLEEHGTHHIVTGDAAGNFVSLTTTVNRLFGAKLTGSSSGVVLNDELDDFAKKTDVAPFGMTESPNRPRAGARPVSSMTPTIVTRDGQVVLAIGGSGGSAIATNVTQLVLARLAFDQHPADLVKASRFSVPTTGPSIRLEKGAAASLIEDLGARGEIVGVEPFTTSAVQMIAVERGKKIPAADPRKHGSARTD